MKSAIFAFVLAAAQLAHGTMTIKLEPSPYSPPASTSAQATYAPAPYSPPASSSATYAPEPAATTAAPTGTFYDKMPMESYKSGGYKELECGYGHVKQEDGTCKPAGWVSRLSQANH